MTSSRNQNWINITIKGVVLPSLAWIVQNNSPTLQNGNLTILASLKLRNMKRPFTKVKREKVKERRMRLYHSRMVSKMVSVFFRVHGRDYRMSLFRKREHDIWLGMEWISFKVYLSFIYEPCPLSREVGVSHD